MTDMASGAHVEIIERTSTTGPLGALVVSPNMVRINGQEVLVPEDATITVSPIDTQSVVTVTLTMFVASLSIRHGD
ncbi:MAG TPA: hypothetical protein PLB92_08425 [Rhodoglobus sp.]|nr:hypothetical protein [Rhodoglobus sp.]